MRDHIHPRWIKMVTSQYSINAWHKITYRLFCRSESKWLQLRIQHQSHIILWQNQRWQSEQSIRVPKDTTYHVLVERNTIANVRNVLYSTKAVFVSLCYSYHRSLGLRSVAVFTVAATVYSAPVVIPEWALWNFFLRPATVRLNQHYGHRYGLDGQSHGFTGQKPHVHSRVADLVVNAYASLSGWLDKTRKTR